MTGEKPSMTGAAMLDYLTKLEQRLADLDRRQAELEKRWEMVLVNIMAAAEKMKRQLDRSTRERAFVEAAASRLLPQVYGHMVHDSQYDQIHMAKYAVRRAVALWQAVDEHFDEKESTNGPEKTA